MNLRRTWEGDLMSKVRAASRERIARDCYSCCGLKSSFQLCQAFGPVMTTLASFSVLHTSNVGDLEEPNAGGILKTVAEKKRVGFMSGAD